MDRTDSDNFEISPKFINPLTIIGAIFVVFTFSLAFVVFPRLNELYQQSSSEPMLSQISLSIGVSIFASIVMMLFFVLGSMSNKIVVSNNFVYFKKKSLLGLGSWSTEKLIDFNQITEINQRTKQVFTGKMVVTYYWLIFVDKKGNSQELLLNQWDRNIFKKLFFYLKSKYPTIKFNNVILKDSSTKLSGLDEYLNKK